MALSQHSSPLPQPRRSPLKPGGQRESELIGYLDQGVNRIQKRVDNRLTKRKTKPAPGESLGYRAFWEAAIDLEGLLDVVWVSASRMSPCPSRANLTDDPHSQFTASLPLEYRHLDRRVPASL